jgi:heme/copper-type cytochrome/quinol oxidase subunit 1
MHGTVMMFLFAAAVGSHCRVPAEAGHAGARDLLKCPSVYAFWAHAIGGPAFSAPFSGASAGQRLFMYQPLSGKGVLTGLCGLGCWALFIEISARLPGRSS